MKLLLLGILLIIELFSGCCYCAKIQYIIGRWISFTDVGELQLNIIGFDTNGYKRERHKVLSKEKFFPNGFVYPNQGYRGIRFYGCQIIHERYGKYYVVGSASFENDELVHEEIVLEPVLLFEWGFKMSTQRMYYVIDTGKCPEIDVEYVKPLPNEMKLENIKLQHDQ